MKSSSFVVVSAVFAAAVGRAGPTEQAILAAMKLSEQPNYSWVSTVNDDARTYEIEGKTNAAGYTWMRMPMVKSVAQRLGRDADSQIEVVFHGTSRCVLRTDNGWKTPGELPRRHRDWIDDEYFMMPPAPIGYMNHGRGLITPDPLDPFPVVLPPPPALKEENETRPYSNAQFAVARPHDELAIIVSSYRDLKIDGDVVLGNLHDIGAQLLLVRDGQDHIKPVCAGGVFRLQIKNGMVVKYQLRLEGILIVDRKKIHVRQQSITTVQKVGATALALPDEAQRKLAAR